MNIEAKTKQIERCEARLYKPYVKISKLFDLEVYTEDAEQFNIDVQVLQTTLRTVLNHLEKMKGDKI